LDAPFSQAAVRSLARIALWTNGYTVLDAQDGEAGLQVCAQYEGPIHMLVTNVVMPKMSGRQLADLVAQAGPDTKILFLSGYTHDAVIRYGVLATAVAFLQNRSPRPLSPARCGKSWTPRPSSRRLHGGWVISIYQGRWRGVAISRPQWRHHRALSAQNRV
jgi:CheY-like chemotaxis protein